MRSGGRSILKLETEAETESETETETETRMDLFGKLIIFEWRDKIIGERRRGAEKERWGMKLTTAQGLYKGERTM